MRFPALVAALAAALVLGCTGDDESPAVSGTPGATPEATTAAVSTTTAGGATRGITGLFTEARPRQADDVFVMASRPPSPFRAWDRESVVLYDVEQGTEVNFGPGIMVSFSPDSKKLAFNSSPPGTVRVIDIATKQSREFPIVGGNARFVADNYLDVDGAVMDIRTGQTQAIDEITDPALKEMAEASRRPPDPGRYRFRDQAKGRAACSDPTPGPDRCVVMANEQQVLEETSTGKVVLEFRALAAFQVGPDELVIATSPQCKSTDGSQKWCGDVVAGLLTDPPQTRTRYAEGTTNIFSVDIASGRATFVATAPFRPNTNTIYSHWPLIANKDYIVWSGGFCSGQKDNTRIFERASGRIRELNAALWVSFTPSGDLGVDPFGPRAILDIETLQWKIVLPENLVDVVESPDGRFLAVGGVLGHGGLCP